MITLDLRKEFKQLYVPSAKQVAVVDVPELQFALIDGAIEAGMDPDNSPAFDGAMAALYGIAYTLKFMSKLRKDNPIDYPVMPLEGLWWIEAGEFDIGRKDNWFWTVMILQPDHITAEMFDDGARPGAQETRRQPCPCPVAPGAVSRRAVSADHAHRSLRRRTSHRCKNGCLRERARLRQAGQAPRDLPG